MPNRNDTAGRMLYLVQHGEAKAEGEDPARPLTDSGQRVVERMAAWVSTAGIDVEQIRHSGKRRAEETAEIFARHLTVPRGVIKVEGLAPNDPVQPIAEALAREKNPIMFVGHLPFLSRLTSLLVLGDPERPIVRFTMGRVVGLSFQEGSWLLRCAIPPDSGQM